MCTSEPGVHSGSPSGRGGFTLLEVLVAMLLTLLLLGASLPVWQGLQVLAVGEVDHAIGVGQSRVAAARFERDLRSASAADSAGAECVAVLEATSSQIVLLTRSGPGAVPEIVEWEVTGGSLMRRRGPWTGSTPTGFPHGGYLDHKTMLEGVEARFAYSGAGFEGLANVEARALGLVRGVRLEGTLLRGDAQSRAVDLRFEGTVYG